MTTFLRHLVYYIHASLPTVGYSPRATRCTQTKLFKALSINSHFSSNDLKEKLEGKLNNMQGGSVKYFVTREDARLIDKHRN